MLFQHALIMAAGRGTRMLPLTNHIPKAMAKIKDETLVGIGINKLKKSIPNIHITVGYKGPLLAQHVLEYDISSVFNTNGKGNSWWIFNTPLKYIDAPILVLTCDNVIELDYEILYSEYERIGSPACMVVPVKPIEGLEGDYIFHEDFRVTELNRNKSSDAYCSGIQVLNPKKINELSEPFDDFYSVWNQLILEEQLYRSVNYPKTWFTIDTLEQLNTANNL